MFQFNPFTGTLDLNSGPGSYADDVLEYVNRNAFPVPGEQGKLYVDKTTDRAYRWPENGADLNSYREVSASEVTSADITSLQTALATKATLPTDSSHSFSQSGQSLALQPARAQFVRVTMSFANGSASVQLPSSGQNYDEVIVDANVGANCTLTVGSIELANTNQYYGIGRRLLRFVRKNNIWNLYEHPYHTHTTNELIFAAAPQVATSPGRAGTLSYAAGNLYVAVGDNQWRRVALATW